MKVKKAKIFAPKKVKGGTSLGREGDVWFAVKCANFSSVEQKAFKTYEMRADNFSIPHPMKRPMMITRLVLRHFS